MEEGIAAAAVLSGVVFGNPWLFIAGALLLIALAILAFLLRLFHGASLGPRLSRAPENPILKPRPEHAWESEAVFNPAAVYENGRVHLFYRALGRDGVSRIGHASSSDGIHFNERSPQPVFELGAPHRLAAEKWRNPFPADGLHYDQYRYASGGGWGGSEDPRAVSLEGRLYMSFSIFESWSSMRLAVTSLPLELLNARRWKWAPHLLISPEGQRNKNWVLFPEKINGKFAILHALTPEVLIEYVDRLEDLHASPIQSNNHRSGRKGAWDAFVRGAGAPPLRTPYGWLLLYHGMDPEHEEVGYKVGAMLLDLNDPRTILYRSAEPILEPKMPYENDWKPGVVYASGAIIKDGALYVYYGGGDKTVNVATAKLEPFLQALMRSGTPRLQRAP